MKHPFEQEKLEIIDRLCQVFQEKLPKKKAEQLSKFFSKFYATVSGDDLEQHTIDDLYGAAVCFWDFIEQRAPKETKVMVYNPNFPDHGWQSTHTIVQIVTADKPFLVDSILMEINRRALTCYLIISLGGIKIQRDASNKITETFAFDDPAGKDVAPEAPIFLEIDRETDPALLADLERSLQEILEEVGAAVADWAAMRDSVTNLMSDLKKHEKMFDLDKWAESLAFLEWAYKDHFTFLGVRDYKLVMKNEEKVLEPIAGTGLGILRDERTSSVPLTLTSMSPEARRMALSHDDILIFTKKGRLSRIHRSAYIDSIGAKIFDEQGKVVGERRILGLYTAEVYNDDPMDIPFLRQKVATILEKSQLKIDSHAGKVLLNILETLPRDDLFQATPDELLEISLGIYYLQERRRIKIFARKDPYGRFMSCLVYVPRERFNTDLRIAMEKVLMTEFHGLESNFYPRFSESVLARIHFIIRLDPKNQFDYDLKSIERKLIEVGRVWQDDLNDQIKEHYGEEKGNDLVGRYANAFQAAYREYYSPRTALFDVDHMQTISESHKLELNVYRPIDDSMSKFRMKIYQADQAIPLSDVLPILENMGLRVITERPNEVKLANDQCIWINDFGMEPKRDAVIDIEEIKENFQTVFRKVWFGLAENDGFNQLVISPGLNWREITVFRAYAKYFRQIGFHFSQSYIEETLFKHPVITKNLSELFHLRFNPETAAKNKSTIEKLEAELKHDMDAVVSLDEDRILRRYFDIIRATLRTSFYQTTAKNKVKPYLSFKLNPSLIPEMPLPLPLYEIFTYSPRFEGCHERKTKVSRGGFRWSDRREDFRTEILGLMKAQTVKNSVIVPSGAKGGFVPKRIPENADNETRLAEGVACYQEFIHSILDLTDNLVDGNVVPPKQVYRYDEDDTYLVVAADKGTATFSDYANAISKEYGFWLGDAFASGGSAGYDHKKMGITARGAWESVKRHFRELGKNIQEEDFTCIGIGDLAGDVFGNGMLLSKHTKLIAAFNHQHIFLDPDPDPLVSFEERKRMFNLPRSSWSDYKLDCISKGGGVFSRSLKSIALSPEIKRALSLEMDVATPNDLIRLILKSPVDLLWNGGIGTFIKGSQEADLEVGDRTNDGIRIKANEVRAKVIGEGGNLGVTQRARVEYSLLGGHVYSDFVDNSGGVDCSDKEVNIKILLNKVVANGDLTDKQRNELLASMTDEVAEIVLKDNYYQTFAISFTSEHAAKHVDLHIAFIDKFEKEGKLDRALEFLPSSQMLMERKLISKGLTRPEIAILLAYAKINLKQDILNSDIPEDQFLSQSLKQSFPVPLQKRYANEMEEHSLRREIIATVLSNIVVNEMGFAYLYRLSEETGATSEQIVRSYMAIRGIFDLGKTFKEIHSLDNIVSAQLQFEMMLRMTRLIRRTTRWFLKNRRSKFDIANEITIFKSKVETVMKILPEVLVGDDLESFNSSLNEFEQIDIPATLKQTIASIPSMLSVFDIIELSLEHNISVEDMSLIYFAINDSLQLGVLRRLIVDQSIESHWEALTREALRDDLDQQQRSVASVILMHGSSGYNFVEQIEHWMDHYQILIKRWKDLLVDLQANPVHTFSMFFVVIRDLLDLTQTSLQTVKHNKDESISVVVPKKMSVASQVPLNKKKGSKARGQQE